MGVISLVYVTVWAVVMAAFFGLAVLLTMLCVPSWRRSLARHPRKAGALALICLPVVGITLWQIISSIADTIGRNFRLQHDVQVEALSLPAGTLLHLMALEPLDRNGQPQIHGLASLDTARFPAPHTLMGAQVTSMQMDGLTSAELRLASDQVIDGWPCAADTLMRVNFDEATRLHPEHWQFGACTLVGGTQIAGVTWPTDSHVENQGREYSVSHWRKPETISIQGIELSNATMRLDDHRKLLRWDGQLHNPMTLGEWRYPRDMRVTQNRPRTLMFTSNTSLTAQNLRTGENLKPNVSILQGFPGGAVRWIKPNAEIDVLDW